MSRWNQDADDLFREEFWRPREQRFEPEIILVRGSPCAGKTTYVQERKQPGDLVWDFDAIAYAIGAEGPHDRADSYTPFVLALRNAFLAQLQRGTEGKQLRVWIIRCAPSRMQRNDIGLRVSQDVLVDTTREECHKRADLAERPAEWHKAIDDYFAKYEP